jgi:hypothetical protein
MNMAHILIRRGGFTALVLLSQFFITGCATLDPEQQRAALEKKVKADLQQADVQMIRPYAVASTKFGSLPEDGQFSAVGWPGDTYFGEKLIAQVQLTMAGPMGLVSKRVVTGSIDTRDIRSVSRAQSSDGYDAILLSMDDNIRYYLLPFGAANLTPFGELKDFVAVTKENGKYQNAQCVDLLLIRLAGVANPRPANAGPQLIDKDPSQFLKEAKTVEGVLEVGWNRVEIDGKAIALIFQNQKTRRTTLLDVVGVMKVPTVPMIGYYKAKENLSLMEKLSVQIPLQVISPGKFGIVVEGVAYAVTIVHATDGSWRYRVQIPEPVQ